MPKKMRKKVLFGVLSEKVKEKRLLVVDGLGKVKPKTKAMAIVIEKLKTKNKKTKKYKILLVLEKDQDKAVRAARNIAGVQIAYFNQLNSYQVLNNHLIIFSKEAMTALSECRGSSLGGEGKVRLQASLARSTKGKAVESLKRKKTPDS